MQKQKGFTLIELMVVVAVIGIIAAIAYPNYTESVRKTRRAAAQACLLQGSQFMERYYTTNLTYANAALPACDASVTTYYTIAFAAAPTATAFTIQATPKSAQATDKCGTMGVTQTGAKTTTGTMTACW